jgi:8-oxo-dGTP diphosphatase
MISIRVYGILINERQQVLVSDEMIRGGYYTKFPGGGLEPGEGTRDCLKREFMEELGLEVSVGEHIYTTDFYQRSAFNPAYQILSIYYAVRALGPINVPLRSQPFDFDATQMEAYQQLQQIESFRFIDLASFGPDSVTLPIDKIVAAMIGSMNNG